jgi:tRNA-intron endonuclease
MSRPFSDEKESLAEVNSLIDARLDESNRAIVEQVQFQDELRAKGFGEKDHADYVLKSYESLYLLYRKKLSFTNKIEITFDSLLNALVKSDKDVMTNFLIYRDLRSRGYVAKEGFGFGNDFRVYERGEFQKKPARYVIFGISEGTNIKARAFGEAVAQVEKMGKEAVIAVIERRGEVIYYKASKMRFAENPHAQNR